MIEKIEKNIAIVEAYYTAMAHKDLADMEQYLHPAMQLTTPLSTVTGKEAVLTAAKQFFSFFKSLNIRAKFGSNNQVMLVIDNDMRTSQARGKFFNFRNSLILPTYHPAYLLCNPSEKKTVCEDMQKIMAKLEL